jgi:hypothetical protein
MSWEAVKTALFSIVGLVGLGGFGWLIKFLLEKLLNHVLERKLTAFKHEQSQEIEKLRADLNHLQDRGVRSNEMEYQALVAAWEGFIDAYHATHASIGKLVQRPDLNRMDEAELEEWLENSKLEPDAKKYIKRSTDKINALSRIERSNDLNDCQKAIWEAQKTVRHKGVFIPTYIEQEFDRALAVLRKVWSEQYVNFDDRGSLPLTATLAFLKTEEEGGESLRARLRDLVRQRVLHELHPRPAF